jgi:hypothetical protein
VPGTCNNIVAGAYVARPPVTNFAAVNLQNAVSAHPLQKCPLYYSQIQMEPQHPITYNNSNTNKKIIYRTFVKNNYPQVPSAGSFNQLINIGILHPTAVLIVPFLAPVTGTNCGLGDSKWKSPFDTGYQHFLEQVNLAEQLTSSDFGISTGLINQNYWENSK